MVTPGFSRPITLRNHVQRESSALCSPATSGSAQMGKATSNECPTSIPKNCCGVTPMMSNGWPYRVSLLPTAAGLPPN